MPSVAELSELAEVVMVNVVLSGDNAIVVAMVAASLPAQLRAKTMFIGIAVATVLRVVFALATTRLYAVLGLRLAGGLLLLWVCWKLWRELRAQRQEDAAVDELEASLQGTASPAGASLSAAVPDGRLEQQGKTFAQALMQIVLADISMSLDNVLAVAGAARSNPMILAIGLVLSIAFMGAAATIIAKVLKRFHWIGYVGLAVIFYVACELIWEGSPAIMDVGAITGML
ncbi:MAG TPA: YjbE family putative metal transport protein [Dongiaceae bacterium]|nr:YjbE family putative metal transport protein [Dongiaceae bacterium]